MPSAAPCHTNHGIVTFRPMSVQETDTLSLARVQICDLTMLLHFHPTCVKMCMIVPPSGRCRPSASATRPTCRRGPACTWSRAGRPTTRPARCPSPTCTFEQVSGEVSIKDMRISDGWMRLGDVACTHQLTLHTGAGALLSPSECLISVFCHSPEP
jgi:hypothetical protein